MQVNQRWLFAAAQGVDVIRGLITGPDNAPIENANITALQLAQTKGPEVEREYRTLTRDYEVAQSKYQEVLSKRQEAELSNNLESQKQGERFTLIEFWRSHRTSKITQRLVRCGKREIA